MIPLRVLLVTFLLTLLAFAVCLLLGIIGIIIGAHLRGAPPNMRLAYTNIAAPAAAMVAAIALISSASLEIRHYRQVRTLNEIEKASE